MESDVKYEIVIRSIRFFVFAVDEVLSENGIYIAARIGSIVKGIIGKMIG